MDKDTNQHIWRQAYYIKSLEWKPSASSGGRAQSVGDIEYSVFMTNGCWYWHQFRDDVSDAFPSMLAARAAANEHHLQTLLAFLVPAN